MAEAGAAAGEWIELKKGGKSRGLWMKCKGIKAAGFEFGSSVATKKDGERVIGINYKLEKVTGRLVKAICCTPDGDEDLPPHAEVPLASG